VAVEPSARRLSQGESRAALRPEDSQSCEAASRTECRIVARGPLGRPVKRDSGIVRCRVRLEQGRLGLPRLGGRLETINELVRFEATDEYSLRAARLSQDDQRREAAPWGTASKLVRGR